MFPKLLKSAKLEDVQKENPALYESMKDVLSAEIGESIAATLQITHSTARAEDAVKITELSNKLLDVTSKYNILSKGVELKQSELAVKLISEGKTEAIALSEIDKAKSNLSSFIASAPAPAGSGSSQDSQEIDSKEKAIDFIMKSNEGVTHAKAVSLARRQYPSLFVSAHLINYTNPNIGKR